MRIPEKNPHATKLKGEKLKNLTHRDLQILNSAIEILHSDFDPRTLGERALKFSEKIVPATCHTFDFFDDNDRYDLTAWSNRPDLSQPEIMKIFEKFIHQHPLIPISLASKDLPALKITDVVSQNEFEQTELYNEFYRLIKVRKQMGSALSVAADLTVCSVFNRKEKEFSERDKQMLTAAAPHLVNAIRNALAYKRINAALDESSCGVISVDSSGKIRFASEFGEKLLERHFGSENGKNSFLPEALRDWLKENRADKKASERQAVQEPLEIETRNSVLTIRRIDNHRAEETLILLEEKKIVSPELFEKLYLTRRESEILFRITQGKTDSEIGMLCDISCRTVQKHVQNIYKKLGVETRTAAMLRAFEIL